MRGNTGARLRWMRADEAVRAPLRLKRYAASWITLLKQGVNERECASSIKMDARGRSRPRSAPRITLLKVAWLRMGQARPGFNSFRVDHRIGLPSQGSSQARNLGLNDLN